MKPNKSENSENSNFVEEQSNIRKKNIRTWMTISCFLLFLHDVTVGFRNFYGKAITNKVVLIVNVGVLSVMYNCLLVYSYVKKSLRVINLSLYLLVFRGILANLNMPSKSDLGSNYVARYGLKVMMLSFS